MPETHGRGKLLPGPWHWEYHPDHRKPIALVSPAGDVLIASGDAETSYAIASEQHLAALAAVPDLIAACESFLQLFRDCDMRPEDECHDVAGRMRKAMAKVKGGNP